MMHILLIEDNDLNRDMLTRRLERVGHKVTCAIDGHAGVQAARDLVPDLILMDINLPDVDGYEATRQILAISHCASVPIFALTADAMPIAVELALAAGCLGLVTKPVDFPALCLLIEETLGIGTEVSP